MSSLDIEFPRAVEFEQEGGPAFNTAVLIQQSGQEQRNRNWINTRGKYTASVIALENVPTGLTPALLEAVLTFFFIVNGKNNSFRYFDPWDNTATSENLSVIPGTSNLQWQLGKNYAIGANTYFRPIYKPIGPPAVDYQDNAFSDTVVLSPAGGTSPTIDHTTGIVTFAGAPSGTPSASFEYHIPVRLDTDEFMPKIVRSSKGNRITRWNFGLQIVNGPNF